jgi:hypothetical protein
MKLFKRCEYCGKIIWIKPIEIFSSVYFHKVCYLERTVKALREELSKTIEQLDYINRVTPTIISNAQKEHKKKFKNKNIILYVSPEVFKTIKKDAQFKYHIYYNTIKADITRYIFDMEILIDENITGWYLK